MGRELRRVPANWEHPKDQSGNYIPLLGYPFAEFLADWIESREKWKQGLVRHPIAHKHGEWVKKPEFLKEYSDFDDFYGDKPDEKCFMPEWPDEEKTHWQMYECTSEGTPISPVMETPEELAQWLEDNKASAFGCEVATYYQWLAMMEIGYAPSAVYTPKTGLQSGVAACDTKSNES